MNAGQMGLFAALGAMVFTGLGLFFYKLSVPFGPVNTTAWLYFFAAALSLPLWAVCGEQHSLTFGNLIWPATIAVCFLLAVLCFNWSVRSIPVATASTVRNLAFVVTALLAFTVGDERCSVRQLAGIVLAVLAIAVIAGKPAPTAPPEVTVSEEIIDG